MQLRESNITRLDERDYDVLIIGGGINGAVSAAALSARGAKVALIDKGDFAGFTSQSSSNLVWGGIKYLESYEFGLVRKLCVSRNRLIRTYPSIVKEIRFLTTLQKGFRKPRVLVWMGTWLYWLIGNLYTRTPRLMSPSDLERNEPVIDTTDSIGGFEYSDAFLVDNDARFVFRFIRDALDHGAVVANYVEAIKAEKAEKADDGVWVVTAKDREGGREITIRAKTLVNACGPHVDALNAVTATKTNHHHVFSKGIHLIVNRLTKESRVLAFFASDGRLFFVIPMGARSCIGTTDTRVTELPARVTDADRQFVLDNINRLLDLETPLTTADIISERCGVRPLVVEGGQSEDGDWTSLSRKHAVEVDAVRKIVSVFGGKLTDCLNVGDEVADAVAGLGIEQRFEQHVWYGEPMAATRHEFFHQAQLLGLDALTAPESSEPLSLRLWRRYGQRAFDLLEDIRQDPKNAEVLIKGTEYIRCELHQAARSEMITRLEDFLRRRSKIAMVERRAVIQQAPGLMEACRILFGADAKRRFDEYFRP